MRFLSLCALAMWALFAAASQVPISEFLSESDSYSPALFWWWNSKLDVRELCAQVDDFYAHGARTLCIHPFPKGFRPGRFPCDMEPEYLSEEFFKIYAQVTDFAAEKGMICWLYDEGGWPSGGACGQVLASDPARFSQRWMTVDEDGRPKLELAQYHPEKESPYPSILEPGVVEKFLSLTHERYKRYVGHHFGKAIPWLFTDEPTAPHGWFSLGWCSDFAEEFKRRKGYDIMPFVPALVKSVKKGPVPEDLKCVRIDYFDTLSQLQLERFVRPCRDWCRANGLAYGGHFDGDDDPKCNLTHGHYNLLRSLRNMDLPGVDCIWRQLHPDSAYSPLPRYASSAAHQNGAKRVLSETFAIYGESITPELMKRTVDFQLVRGVNQFVFAFACQSTKRNFMSIGDPHFGKMDPKWPFIKPFMDYVRDSAFRLASGTNPVRVAVYYDVKSIWAGGLDPKEETSSAISAHMDVARGLEARQVDFDFIDDDLIEEGRLPYAVIVLPTSKWLSDKAKANLTDFRRRGGSVVFEGELNNVPRTCRAVGSGAENLRVTKRLLPDGAIDYFLVNESDRTIAPEISFDEGPKLVRVMDPFASEFIRIFPDGGMEVPDSRPTIVTKRILRDGWTVRKSWSVKPGKEDFEYEKYREDERPCQLGDWRSFFGTNFSGRAIYRLDFTAPKSKAELDLGKVGVCASVRLNGRLLTPRFFPPFRWLVDLEFGTNELEVAVGNTLANALVPELDRIGREFPPPSSWAARENAFYEKDDLASGLIGPVTLGIVSVSPLAEPLSSYRETSVDSEARQRLKEEISAALVTARSQAVDFRSRFEKTFGRISSFQSRRFAKRMELFESAISVAEKRFRRGAASDFAQDERALDDLREFVRYFERELQLWPDYPENPDVDPIVLDIRDFGAKGDGLAIENSAFERAFAAVRALGGRPSVLKVPSGDYLLNASPYNLEVSGLTNFVLHGESPEKVCLICGRYDAGCVRIRKCENVTVRGVQNRFVKPTFCQGKVMAADQEAGRIEIELADGSLPPTDPSWTNHYAVVRGSLYTEDGRMDPDCPNVAYEFDSEELGNGKYAVFFSTRFTKKRYGKLTPGRILALPNRDNRYSAMVIAESELCNFEEVWVRQARAAAFAGDVASPRYTSMIACRVFPLPDFVMSSCADSCIVPTGAYLENCDFRGMGDDGLNTLTRGGFVCGKTSADTFVHQLNPRQYEPGTFVQFMDSATGEFLGNARVEKTTRGRWRGLDVCVTKVDRPLPEGICTYDDLGRGPVSFWSLDQATVGQGTVDATPSHVYAPNWWGVGSVVSGCRFANTRCAGLVLQNSNTLVENCVVENVKVGFRINALGDFREGPPPQNVIVRNCRFNDMFEDGIIIFQNLQKSVSPTASIGFVRIENCAFSTVRKNPTWILSLTDSLFRNVTLDGRPMPISFYKSSKCNVIQ